MEMFFKLCSDLVLAILPEKSTTEDRHIYRWRQTVAMAIILGIVSFTVHIAIECNLIPGYDTGFARSVDLDNLKQQSQRYERADLEDRMVSSMQSLCAADIQKNEAAKQLWARHIFDLQHVYAELNGGKVYDLANLDCTHF